MLMFFWGNDIMALLGLQRSVGNRWQRVLCSAGGLLLSVGLLAGNAVAQALPPELAAVWKSTKLPENALSLVVRSEERR